MLACLNTADFFDVIFSVMCVLMFCASAFQDFLCSAFVLQQDDADCQILLTVAVSALQFWPHDESRTTTECHESRPCESNARDNNQQYRINCSHVCC